MESVVIIIPVYNEGTVVKDTVNNIPREFKHIVCVDDGSSDDTKEQILKTRAVVVRHAINLGQGAALQTGIDYALLAGQYKYFVTYDADGQHRIEDVKVLLTLLKKEKLDIVLGSRFLGNVLNISQFKKMMLKLAVRFSNVMTGVKLTDTHNGLRVFTRATAEKLQLTMSDFAHSSEVIERIAEKKLKYAEAPVTITYTDYSRSKGQAAINAVNIVFDVILSKLVKR